MEDFRKKLKKDTLIYIGFIVMGVIGFVLMVVFGKNNSGVNSIAGFCGALITISIMFIIRNSSVVQAFLQAGMKEAVTSTHSLNVLQGNSGHFPQSETPFLAQQAEIP